MLCSEFRLPSLESRFVLLLSFPLLAFAEFRVEFGVLHLSRDPTCELPSSGFLLAESRVRVLNRWVSESLCSIFLSFCFAFAEFAVVSESIFKSVLMRFSALFSLQSCVAESGLFLVIEIESVLFL